MNITSLYTVDRHDVGADMTVKDENGQDIDVTIKIAGVDSKLFRKVKSDLRRDVLANPDGDQEVMRAASLAEMTLGWSGLLDDDKEYEFSAENAEKLYLNAPYIMDQVDGFIVKRSNFTTG